ncbi:MAG TPA: hypothetical protein GX503_06475 [Clostridiales bacterium]|nr:hypothetical protein [Clostridiales bacterium]
MKKGEKKEIAAALQYNPTKAHAPTVIAKGRGIVAQKIKEIAQKNNVPIYKDEKLAEQLNALSIGEEIPPELYQVIAEILAFIIRLDTEETIYDEKK